MKHHHINCFLVVGVFAWATFVRSWIQFFAFGITMFSLMILEEYMLGKRK